MILFLDNKQNIKLVNNDGREVVLRQMDNGEYIIINDYKNIGTYNFQNPVPINRILDWIAKENIEHYIQDVKLYFKYGNTTYDKEGKPKWKN